eukprot:11200954-Lingulodinium_polyedra.AAC.1
MQHELGSMSPYMRRASGAAGSGGSGLASHKGHPNELNVLNNHRVGTPGGPVDDSLRISPLHPAVRTNWQ